MFLRSSFYGPVRFSRFSEADFFNPVDTALSVGFEKKSKKFGDPVVELLAVVGIYKIFAICASRITIFKTAGSEFAPSRLGILVTTTTFPTQIATTSSTIQTAEGDEIFIRLYLFHYISYHFFSFISPKIPKLSNNGHTNFISIFYCFAVSYKFSSQNRVSKINKLSNKFKLLPNFFKLNYRFS